ncbi:MAG: 3-phosphoglycerate dehydrogenase [Sphingomonadales bacterium]|nr:3-phosphoglycerate dehydrogenase [Sphingomonadales bacterium]
MKILANDGIDQAGKDLLEQASHQVVTTKVPQDQLHQELPGYDGIVVRSATKVRTDLIDACPNLRFIARAGVGMDNIDVEYARSKGIAVINTPAASSIAVAELVFAHMLSLCRFLPLAHREMPSRGAAEFNALKASYAAGTELFGKTLGIVGFGHIGQEVARIAHGFRMKILVHDLVFEQQPELAQSSISQHKVEVLGLEALLRQSHYLTLHLPGLREPLITAERIAMMPYGACIVNCSRGGLVDESALLTALNSRHLRYAGLDVFANEPNPLQDLLKHPGVSSTPHTGASTLEAQERIGIEMAQRIIEAFQA